MRAWIAALSIGAALLIGCGECEEDFDCPGSRVCRDGQCERFICRDHRDCPPAQTCASNRCRATPPREAATPVVSPPASLTERR